MKTSFKTITNIQRWRLAAIALGSALALTLSTSAFAMGPGPQPPSLNGNNNATGTVLVFFSYQISATNSPTSYGATGLPPGLTINTTNGAISGTPTTLGTYDPVHLTATNGVGTGSKDVRFTINSAPTAIATSSPPAVWEGETVTLDGSGSDTNPPGGTLTYLWTQQAPASPVLSLSPINGKAVTETFTAPTVPLLALTQAVTFQLKVTDASVSGTAKNTNSDPVTTTVYASPGADAEPKDTHVNENTGVMLSGNATRAQPGATFDYTWTAPAGIMLSNIHAQYPTFTAPSVGITGQALTFSLIVTEHVAGLANAKNSASDSVTINVDNVNQPPTAYASSDPNNIVSMATVPEITDPVTLYGSGSDPDGDGLTFSWTQVIQAGDPIVTLTGDTSATPTFTAPNLTTQSSVDLVFQLIVNDGHLNSGASTVTIRVLNTNDPPVAVPIAIPSSALEGDTVTLDGSGSTDPNHDTPLYYAWTQVGTPVVTLSDEHAAAPTFIAPDVSAGQGSITLTFNLTVSDRAPGDPNALTNTEPVSVNVSHKNQPPLADAGQPSTVPEMSNACLDGSGSYDPEDGPNVTFAWVQVPTAGEPLVGLDNPNTSKPCFDTPDVGPGGADLHFQLTVKDSHLASSSAPVLVHVNYTNHPPTAHAGDDQTVDEGVPVHLDGSFSTDPDGNPLTYAWSQVSGPAVTIVPDPVDLSKVTFTAPPVPCGGAHVVMRLNVHDTYGDVNPDGIPDDVDITVHNVNHDPTADAGGNQTNIPEGTTVELHGTGGDTDGEAVTFQWTQVPQIGEPAVTLSPSSGKDVSFTAPTVPGGDPNASVDLHFVLTANDTCSGSTTTGAITVQVANTAHNPVAVAQANPTSANEGGATVQLDGSMSSDPDFDPLTYTWEQTAGPSVTLVYGPGDTGHVMPMFVTPWVSADTPLKFKLTVSNPWDTPSTACVTVTVINSHTPPDANHARADVPVLWPPDHKMAQVHIIGLDNLNNDPITIDTVTQDERTNGLGDGDTPIDANINGDTVLLRAERSGNGNGRVYKVCFTIHDPEQNATGCVNVMVPKSKKTDVAIDSGQNYDSTH